MSIWLSTRHRSRLREPVGPVSPAARAMAHVVRARRGHSGHQATESAPCDIPGGPHVDDAEAAASSTARGVGESMLTPDDVARLRWHRSEGHRVAEASASFVHRVAPVVRAREAADPITAICEANTAT